jgi:hypothetical protein
MVNRTATATALLLLAGLAAVVPTASAAYNKCTNEASDIDVLNAKILGVDGPVLGDGNGEQVCLFDRTFSVEYNGNTDGTPPPGLGFTVRLCEAIGDTADECNTTAGNVVLLDWTGVTVFCRPTAVSVCVWADGIPLELNP